MHHVSRDVDLEGTRTPQGPHDSHQCERAQLQGQALMSKMT